MAEFQSVDDFLNYRGSEGNGGKRLKSWAKDKGYLNFWLHTQQFPCAVWYHRLPELVVRTDKDDPSITRKNVWGRQHVCWEDDTVLKKQHFRSGEGEREFPPKRCGICRLNEWIRSAIREGVVRDTDILFKWDGSDKPEENTVLHAGGMAAVWKRDKLDEATKKRLGEHGIFMGNGPGGRPGAWAESALAKLSYIFVGVDNDDVGAGVQVAVQTKDVGEKVRRLINNEIASNDGDAGNPFVNPYCIQIVYRPEEKEFGKKYDALRMNRYRYSPEIERLVRGEKPSLKRYVERYDMAMIRSQLEHRATREIPWDSIFDVPAGVADEAPPVEAPKPRTQVQVPPSPPKEEMGDPCDDCGTPMTKTQTKCTKCGAVYAVEPTAPKPSTEATAKDVLASPSTEDEGVYDEDVPF